MPFFKRLKKIIFIIVLANLFLVCNSSHAETQQNLNQMFVTRKEWNDWINTFLMNFNQLDQSVNNTLNNEVRFQMWVRDVKDETDPVVYPEQTEQYMMKLDAIKAGQGSNIFPVTFVMSGGTWRTCQKLMYRKGNEYTVLPGESDISNIGKTFAGWYDNINMKGPVVTAIPANTNKPTIFYAKWKDSSIDPSDDPTEETDKIGLTYHMGGGNWISGYTPTKRYKQDEGMSLPNSDKIVMSGYNFDGWYKTSEYNPSDKLTSIPANTDPAIKNVYAKWSPIQYTITFDTGGHATAPGNVTKTYDQDLTLPDPTDIDSGYVFAGWCADTTYTTKYDGTTELSTTDGSSVTLHAMWKATVTFNKNGHGSAPAAIETAIGSTITLPNMNASGYIFAGWYTESGCTNKVGDYGQEYEVSVSTTTLFARWDVTLRFDSKGHGNVLDPITKIADTTDTFINLPNPSNGDGYEFKAWYEEPECEYKVGKSGDPYRIFTSATLYARWEPIVTFNSNGHGPDHGSRSYREGSNIGLPGFNPVDGYECTGWYTEAECINKVADPRGTYTVTVPIELFAGWKEEEITYNMVYHLDHGSTTASLTSTRKYTLDATLPNNEYMKPDTGYKFRGWYSDASHTTLITSVAYTTITDVYAGFEPMNSWSSIGYSSWMSKIPDDMYLTEINIPGAHDAGCYKVDSASANPMMNLVKNYAITQGHYVAGNKGSDVGQLAVGVRAFDIRLDDNLNLCHGDHSMDVSTKYFAMDNKDKKITLEVVFNEMATFLNSHPTETVILLLTNEHGSGDADTVRTEANKVINKYKTNYDGLPNYKGIYTNTSIPKLGDVRGKIVILDDGLSLSTGIRYSSFQGGTKDGVTFVYENNYNISADDKWKKIEDALDICSGHKINCQINKSAKTPNSGNIWTNSNCAPLGSDPDKIDDVISPKRENYGWVQGAAYGIVWMDFVRQDLGDGKTDKGKNDTKPIITSNP